MEFIAKESDINDEQITDDLDLGPSPHSLDWKLNPNVECRVTLERMKSFHKVRRDLDKNDEEETEISSPLRADKPCRIYRMLKLLVDVLKTCEKREECGLCEKYIQQLQHLLLTHGNNTGTAQERNSIQTEPISRDPSGVPFHKEKSSVKMSPGDDVENTEDEFVAPLTTGCDSEGQPSSHRNDPNKIQRMSISKGGKSKPFKCGTCGKGFLTFYDLTQHKRIHLPETRNPRHLNRKDRKKDLEINTHLTTHKIVHTGEKQFRCELCGEFFAQLGSLTRHILTHPRETPHKCKVCGKCFHFRSFLAAHKLSHTGEKPHRCDVCGKSFGFRHTLAQHKLIHTGEKRFKCELCGKCFTQNGNLREHIQTHTGEMPHKCELCGERFKSRTCFRRHKLVHAKQ